MNNDDNNIRAIIKMRAVHELHVLPSTENENYNNAFYGNDDWNCEYCMNTTAWD